MLKTLRKCAAIEHSTTKVGWVKRYLRVRCRELRRVSRLCDQLKYFATETAPAKAFEAKGVLCLPLSVYHLVPF